jgi:phosphotransacetylase
MREAAELARDRLVGAEIDGEMQADVALNRDFRQQEFPFCTLTGNANVLVFPNLDAANIAYKLLTNIADFTPTGSIVAGLSKPANILHRGAHVQEIVNMIYVSAQQTLHKEGRRQTAQLVPRK